VPTDTTPFALEPPVKEPAYLLDQLRLVEEQFDVLCEAVAKLHRQQRELSFSVAQMRSKHEAAHPDSVSTGAPHPPPQATMADCERDILRVLDGAGHPLTILEILAELVRQRLSWRENVVRHALLELLDRGAIRDASSVRPHSYALASALHQA
jgi:hypothetical protein